MYPSTMQGYRPYIPGVVNDEDKMIADDIGGDMVNNAYRNSSRTTWEPVGNSILDLSFVTTQRESHRITCITSRRHPNI